MTDLEIQFNSFFQRKLEFYIDGKLVKEGKLILINQKDFYINLYLKTESGEQKKYELPYPFKIHKNKNSLVLEYTLSALAVGDFDIYFRLLSLNKNFHSKLYNNKMTILEKK